MINDIVYYVSNYLAYICPEHDWNRLFKYLHACQCGREKNQEHRHESINIYHMKQLHITQNIGLCVSVFICGYS